jgi:hypothetical protein
MKKILEAILFILIIAFGVTILAFGFRMLYEVVKSIF